MKNYKKAIIAMLAAVPFAFAFTACSGESGTGESSSASESIVSIISEQSAASESSSQESTASSSESTSSSEDSGSAESTSSSENSGSEESSGSTADITDVSAALNILSKLLNRPDPWSFFPDALTDEQLATAATVPDFSTDTNVSAIPSNAIGQELAVIYQGLNQAETVLSAASAVYTAGEAIAAVYQTYINSNPNDYANFTGSVTIGGSEFSVKITLDGAQYTLLAGNGTVCAELSTDGTTDEGRIQITNGAVLKYTSSQTQLHLAVEFSATILGYTGVFTQDITFVRSDTAITGYMYEYLGTTSGTGTDLARALYYSDDNYTAVTSDAKDSGSSLSVDAYTEVYSSKTGEFIGAEVAESLSAVSYDTYWFNLADVTGITSVKVTDEENEDNTLNANTVYINGSTTPFASEWNTKLTIKTSRKYDIEMKTVYYVTATESDGQTTYSLTEAQIPMLFVQADELSAFATDVVTNNSGAISAAALPEYSVISSYYTISEDAYLALEESMSYTVTLAFIGEKDSFFA